MGEMFEAARKQGMKTIATFHEPPGEMFEAGREYCLEGVGVNNPEYADLSKDGMVLMFIPAEHHGISGEEKLGIGVNLYMQIDGDIDEYYDELKKRGVKIAVDIKDEPFGVRDFTAVDIDGYKLVKSVSHGPKQEI